MMIWIWIYRIAVLGIIGILSYLSWKTVRRMLIIQKKYGNLRKKYVILKGKYLNLGRSKINQTFNLRRTNESFN